MIKLYICLKICTYNYQSIGNCMGSTMSNYTSLVGLKFGCLEILDDGSEYPIVINEKISCIRDEKVEFISALQVGKLEHQNAYCSDGTSIPGGIYCPRTFEAYSDRVDANDFDREVTRLLKTCEIPHYKCKCSKCGKIRYYTWDTLQANPQYCLRPMYLTQKHFYSNRAANATANKRDKYENNESVLFVNDKSKVIASDEYCEKWNDRQNAKLKKQAEKYVDIIASIPRKLAKNYDKDYVGTVYESLEVLECINDSLESIPTPHYTQRHKIVYDDIIVYKQYRCRCYLCGKEQFVKCSQFGIYPPTSYGYRAYNGYWSDICCDCHVPSSFEWIVNKLLLENNIPYRVEYSFPDLFGHYGKRQLRFDFAIFNNDNSIRCLIECQGQQHYKPVDDFGGEEALEEQAINDELKREYAKVHHIPLFEIPYTDKAYEKVKETLLKDRII